MDTYIHTKVYKVIKYEKILVNYFSLDKIKRTEAILWTWKTNLKKTKYIDISLVLVLVILVKNNNKITTTSSLMGQ